MKNRGIARARMFFGGLILFAAIIAWGTALIMRRRALSLAIER